MYLKNKYFISSKEKKINPGASILRQNLEKKGVDLSLGIFQGECHGHYQTAEPLYPSFVSCVLGRQNKKNLGKSKVAYLR